METEFIQAIENAKISEENNAKNSVQTLKNSILPSIQETERFIFFLNKRFNLGIQDDLIINIQETSKNAKGYFMPINHPKHYEVDKNSSQILTETPQDALKEDNPNKTTPLNLIVISSLYLKETPYITITHELAHYINQKDGFSAKNNYHHKHFKQTAETLLLSVQKGKYGYNITNETPEFLEMLKEFSPNKDAFLIFQNTNEQKKKKSRNLKYICSCVPACIIRTAKNENKPINAVCLYCNSPFIEVIGKDGEKENEE